MPVRNALPYLDQAVQSILAQSHGNFEFVIGDDCSTDGSRERLRQLAQCDARIRLLESDVPLGPVRSSNWVAMAATCPLVARMDSEDIARPDRLEVELRVLNEFPDAVLVGSLFSSIDHVGRETRPRDRSRLVNGHGMPITHGSLMYRHDAFVRAGGYREGCDFFEDFDLFFRLGREGALLALPEALYIVRYNEGSGRLSQAQDHVEKSLDRRFRLVKQIRKLGYERAIAEDGVNHASSEKIALEVLVAIGSLRLWSGRRPSVFWRILRRAELGCNRGAVRSLLWALWGSVSPTSLRAVIRFIAKRKDQAASRTIRDGQVYQWWCNEGGVARVPVARNGVDTATSAEGG